MEIISKAGKNDVCKMQLHKQTCPLCWELGGYTTVQILNEWHSLCTGGACTDKLEKNYVYFLKVLMQVLFSSCTTACNNNRRISLLD